MTEPTRTTSERRTVPQRAPRWRVWSRSALPFLVVAAGGFAAAYLVMSLVVFPGGLVAEGLEVPNVVGMSYDAAAQQLRSYGFEPERGEERYSAEAPSYSVLAQSPPAGVREARGASIRLDVSRGQRRGEVPLVTGLTRQQAEAQLMNAGFDVGDVTVRESEAPRGQVIGTTPAAGASVVLPAEVRLVVSTGPSTVDLPDLTGEYYQQARTLLEQLGLRSEVRWDSLSFMSDDTVIGQSPAAGQPVAAGAVVTLTVAGRPR